MRRDLIFYGIGALLLLGGGTIVYTATRGYRNNNPGNIALTSPPTPWQGWIGDAAQSDTTFVQFTDMTDGIRAIARVLNNYYSQGYQSVDAIIRRWSATDQDAYVANVAAKLGIDPGAILTFPDSLPVLIGAIIAQENGVNLVPDSTIAQGIALA